jgi:hypothetical protein
MEIDVKVGNYELVYSISVIQIENLPIQIRLPDTFGELYVLTFQFIKDQVNLSTVTRLTTKDRLHLNIDFVNFFNSEQTGNVKLLEVGTLHNYPLFLNYRVTPLKGATRTILFNFYIRKEV